MDYFENFLRFSKGTLLLPARKNDNVLTLDIFDTIWSQMIENWRFEEVLKR